MPAVNPGRQNPLPSQCSPAEQQPPAHASQTFGALGSTHTWSTHSSPPAQRSPQIAPGPHYQDAHSSPERGSGAQTVKSLQYIPAGQPEVWPGCSQSTPSAILRSRQDPSEHT